MYRSSISSRRRLATLGGLLVFLSLLAFPQTALAHALLLRSSPAQDAILPTSPHLIHLWFSEDLNGSASRIVVWDRYRHDVTLGNPFIVPGQPRQMEVRLKPLPAGSYLVLWTSVSAEDGHLLRGSYLFSVKRPGPGPSLTGVSFSSSQTFPDVPGLISILAHWLELLAAVGWAGLAGFSAIVLGGMLHRLEEPDLDRERRRLRATLLTTLLVLLVSSTVVLFMQGFGLANNNWRTVFSRTILLDLFAGQYGQLWIARQVVVLIGLAVLAYAWNRGPGRRAHAELAGMQAVAAAIYLYAFAASGHAAAVNVGVVPGQHGRLFSLAILVDWTHFAADAMWLGGQMYVVLILIHTLRPGWSWTSTETFLDILNRFSPAAYVSVGILSLSGIFNGAVHIPSWYAFFSSVYGRTLIVKILLVGGMMLVSMVTVYVIRPRIRRVLATGMLDARAVEGPTGTLVNWLRAGPVLGAGVLLATSVMFSYPVPAGFSPAGPQAYTTSSGGLTATLTLTPDRSGPNVVTVTLKNRNGGPVTRATVRVLTINLDMEMGTGLAPLHEVSPGRYSGTADLGMGGRWRLEVLVFSPAGLQRMSVRVIVGT